jgi:CRISPR-associated endonuclease Cas1
MTLFLGMRDIETIPLSALNQYVYCPRRCYLIHAEGEFEGNFHTLRGSFEQSGWTAFGMSRRPPMDPMNALLSFLYAVLLNDCRSALEAVGLDPQLGFLHAVRPGRMALALDLIGLLPHVQARLLARYLRGDAPAYVPYLRR